MSDTKALELEWMAAVTRFIVSTHALLPERWMRDELAPDMIAVVRLEAAAKAERGEKDGKKWPDAGGTTT